MTSGPIIIDPASFMAMLKGAGDIDVNSPGTKSPDDSGRDQPEGHHSKDDIVLDGGRETREPNSEASDHSEVSERECSTTDSTAQGSVGDGDLDVSVVELEDEGGEVPGSDSASWSLGLSNYDSSLSPEENMQRLQETIRLVQPSAFVDRKVRRRGSRKRNMVSRVQTTGRLELKSTRDSSVQKRDGEEVQGTDSSGACDTEGEAPRLGVDFTGSSVVERPAEPEDPRVSGVHKPADGARLALSPGIDGRLLQVKELSRGNKLVGKVSTRDFLPIPSDDNGDHVEQVVGFVSTETYEATYSLDPTTLPDSIPNCGSSSFVVGQESILSRMGGKRHLKAWLVTRFPRNIQTYVEPFGGSFQVLLWKPWRDRIEIINDVDADLVHFFRYAIFDPEGLVHFVNALPTHEAIILGLREALAEGNLSGLERAAAYSISVSSSFNAMGFSHGRYASSPTVRLNTSLDLSKVLRIASRLRGVDIRSTSYTRLLDAAVKKIPGGGFYYLDPPYDKTEGYSSFQGSLGFGWTDQVKLCGYCERIHSLGNRFIQTNSATDRLIELYGSVKNGDGSPAFFIKKKNVYYSIAGKAEARDKKEEIIISNYDLSENNSPDEQRRMF